MPPLSIRTPGGRLTVRRLRRRRDRRQRRSGCGPRRRRSLGWPQRRGESEPTGSPFERVAVAGALDLVDQGRVDQAAAVAAGRRHSGGQREQQRLTPAPPRGGPFSRVSSLSAMEAREPLGGRRAAARRAARLPPRRPPVGRADVDRGGAAEAGEAAVRFSAHDWLVDDRSGFGFRFDFFGSRFRLRPLRVRRLPVRLLRVRVRPLRLRRTSAASFGSLLASASAAARCRLAAALAPSCLRGGRCSLSSRLAEHRVVAGRHLDEDDPPEQGEADQRDRDHAAAQPAGSLLLGAQLTLGRSLRPVFDRSMSDLDGMRNGHLNRG